jgi:hypothetical protein
MRAYIAVIAALTISGCDRPIVVKLVGQEKPPGQATSQIGRYQAIPIPKGSSNTLIDSVLLLDTQDGDLWEWSEASGLGTYRGGLFLRYMGHLTPGGNIGDMVDKKTN